MPGRYGGRALAARAACARQSRDVVAFRLSRNVATMDVMAERKRWISWRMLHRYVTVPSCLGAGLVQGGSVRAGVRAQRDHETVGSDRGLCSRIRPWLWGESASGGEPGTAGVAPDIVLCVAVVSGTLAYVAPRERHRLLCTCVHSRETADSDTERRTGGDRDGSALRNRRRFHPLLLFTKLEVASPRVSKAPLPPAHCPLASSWRVCVIDRSPPAATVSEVSRSTRARRLSRCWPRML